MIAREVEIIDGTGLAIANTDATHYFVFTATVNLTANFAVTMAAPKQPISPYYFYNRAIVTNAGGTITLFGNAIPTGWDAKNWSAVATYNGSSWSVQYVPDFEESGFIESKNFKALAVDTAALGNLSVTTGKIAALAVDDTKLAANSVITTKILNNNVTLGKIQQLSANTVLCNPTAGAADPSELTFAASTIAARLAAGNFKACSVAEIQTLLAVQTTALADGTIWIGSGAGLATARTLTGDVTVSNTGVTSIGASKVLEANLGQTTLATGFKGITAAQVVTGVDFVALMDGNLHNVFALKQDDVIIRIILSINAVAAGITCDVGADANIRGGGALGDCFIVNADVATKGKYSTEQATYDGTEMEYGWFQCAADGNVTIQTSADATATVTGSIAVFYLPA